MNIRDSDAAAFWRRPRSARQYRIGVCLLLVVLGVVSPVFAAKRIDLYDAEGRHQGYAMVHHRVGRVDYYDLSDRRIGWGRINPLSEGCRVDLFAADGSKRGYALVESGAGRVEIFDNTSRLVGSGSLDKRGHVTMFDLSGRRRADMALPIQKTCQPPE